MLEAWGSPVHFLGVVRLVGSLAGPFPGFALLRRDCLGALLAVSLFPLVGEHGRPVAPVLETSVSCLRAPSRLLEFSSFWVAALAR
jgi:hypothetical protein